MIHQSPTFLFLFFRFVTFEVNGRTYSEVHCQYILVLVKYWQYWEYWWYQSPIFLCLIFRFVTVEVNGDAEENQNPKALPEDGWEAFFVVFVYMCISWVFCGFLRVCIRVRTRMRLFFVCTGTSCVCWAYVICALVCIPGIHSFVC